MVQRKSGVYIEEEDTLISVSRLCLHVQNEKVTSKKSRKKSSQQASSGRQRN